MELRNLINNLNNEETILDDENIKITDILADNKYNLLNKFLIDNDIIYTNDLKKLDISKYNYLKMQIPKLYGVGEQKINQFLLKLDYIRKNKNIRNNYEKSYFEQNQSISNNLGFFNKLINYFSFRLKKRKK